MTLMIDLRPEAEAILAERAANKGVSLNEYVSELLHAYIPDFAADRLSPSERAALWRAGTENLPWTPPLSDEAISRESIYSRDE